MSSSVKPNISQEFENVNQEIQEIFERHPHLKSTFKEQHQQHLQRLTRYNRIKDIGQMLLGLCAEKAGGTIKEQYEAFGIDLDD